MRFFLAQPETLCRVGNPIFRSILGDWGQMGTTVKESCYACARRVRCLENCTNSFSGFPNGLPSPGQESSAQAAEQALIDRVLSGHKELFMDLVRPHERMVYATVFPLLANKEDAEDVTQDTLMKRLPGSWD
jgi:hypothetical protein